MKALRYIRNWLHRLLCSQICLPTEIDSHQWENKFEILSSLSRSHS
jgi:hypothetical protein